MTRKTNHIGHKAENSMTKKKLAALAALALIGAVILACLCQPPSAQAATPDWRKGWEKLASRTVNLSTEQDETPLSHKGKLQKLVFEVRKASVNFKDVKVHLLTGQVLDIPVRSVIKEGDRTAVIDLPGEARTVKKIVFTYESLRSRRAEVVVWGKKN